MTEEKFKEWFQCTLNQDFENREDELGQPLAFEQGSANGPIHLDNSTGRPDDPKSLVVFGYYSNTCLETISYVLMKKPYHFLIICLRSKNNIRLIELKPLYNFIIAKSVVNSMLLK